MTWWTIVGYGHEIGFTTLYVAASTSTEDHLWMSWSIHKPTAHEIWRVVRGKRIFCGFQYIWNTPHIVEQAQHGDTLFHSFSIAGIPIGSHVWYYLNAPDGPYGREIQGPLMHVQLLTGPAWSEKAYFVSKTKGIFKTADLSGPGGPQPTWIPDNGTLPFLDVRQACSDPWDPYHRRFIICHDDVYRMDNFIFADPATSTRVLTAAEAVALTGGQPGDILWVAGNANYERHFYLLWKADVPGTGIWCLKTIDYGDHWTAHQIDNSIWSFNAGNIMAGKAKGTSPYPPGEVLYATINVGIGGAIYVCRSLDEGNSWARTPTRPPGTGLWEPRLHVDPTDQGTVYVSAATGGTDLWRSTDHGATWALCDQGNHLRIIISPTATSGTMAIRPSDPDQIRVLADLHIWKTSDFGLIWRDQGAVQYSTRELHLKPYSYDFLYLARITDAPAPDGIYAQHVLFVSQDEGSNMFGKAGDHPDQADGGGDSIPHDCGGAALEGVLTLP